MRGGSLDPHEDRQADSTDQEGSQCAGCRPPVGPRADRCGRQPVCGDRGREEARDLEPPARPAVVVGQQREHDCGGAGRKGLGEQAAEQWSHRRRRPGRRAQTPKVRPRSRPVQEPAIKGYVVPTMVAAPAPWVRREATSTPPAGSRQFSHDTANTAGPQRQTRLPAAARPAPERGRPIATRKKGGLQAGRDLGQSQVDDDHVDQRHEGAEAVRHHRPSCPCHPVASSLPAWLDGGAPAATDTHRPGDPRLNFRLTGVRTSGLPR